MIKSVSISFPALPLVETRTISLNNNSNGLLHHLNYPREMPPNVDLMMHLMVPLGEVISLELHGVVLSAGGCNDHQDASHDNEREDDSGYRSGNDGNGQRLTVTQKSRLNEEAEHHLLEVYDNYADVNGTKWVLCAKRDQPRNRLPMQRGSSEADRSAEGDNGDSSPVFITSYLNTLHIRQKSGPALNSVDQSRQGGRLNATIKVYEDKLYRPKLASKDVWVESCQPNPCQFGGKCVETKEMKRCECRGHYSGRFCGLTICDFDPCLFGTCELTENSFKCNCLPGYLGSTCEQKKQACSDNPCQGRGECFEKNNGFYCR